MDLFLADWLNLLLRWAHIVVGIGWIGTSFYFMALDYSLRRREGMAPGIQGTAWQVHGGGFYNIEKFAVAPASLPPDLKWFRWDAYLTWVTGFALLAVQYYWNARAYLIDPAVLPLEPWQAIAISVASVFVGWKLYDTACRSPLGENPVALAAVVFAMILAASVLFSNVYSGRGAFIHVGVFVGTIMAANVFLVIVPNQKKIVADLVAGRAPDGRLGAIGKQRSTHNNYLTLPVLLMMVSNHYPFLYSHPHSWLVVALILVSGALARHVVNRHDAGDPPARFVWAAPAAAVAILAAIVVTAPRSGAAVGPVADNRALEIATGHCAACHARKPTHESFSEAPKDVVLETLDDLRRFATLVRKQTVQSKAMPLGNETGMTDAERAELGAWLARQR